MNIRREKGLTFDDVLLVPKISKAMPNKVILKSRITKDIILDIPLISAAMDTVTEENMAIEMAKLGGMGVLHRNCTLEEEVGMVKKVKKAGKYLVGAAVGPHDIKRAKALAEEKVDILFVDCAHAHHKQVIEDAKKIKKLGVPLVVGNIATAEAAIDLIEIADALKVGIGPGSICTTRIVAGVGVPQLTAVSEVCNVARSSNIPVIADGGIRYSGDIVKALAAGAEIVMLGSVLAGTKETPGETMKLEGEVCKAYRGMGSLAALKKRQSSDRYLQNKDVVKKFVPEGVEGMVRYKGEMEKIIYQMIGGLRSGMGYIGASEISKMPERAEFIQVSSNGIRESHPHTLSYHSAPNYS